MIEATCSAVFTPQVVIDMLTDASTEAESLVNLQEFIGKRIQVKVDRPTPRSSTTWC